MKAFFELAKILKPQGIKGEVKLEAYTDSLERFKYLDFIYFKQNDEYVKHPIESKRIDSKYAYIKLEGINTRDDAEKLRQKIIYVDREHAAKLEEGCYYIQDLIGLSVTDEKANKLGILKNILNTGSKDIYVVEVSSEKELMFAAVDGVIIQKNINEGIIKVDSCKLEEVGIYNDI